MSDTTLPTDDEHDEYVGWTIVAVGDNHSLLLRSPIGKRQRVLFRVHEVQRLEEEIERLRDENFALRCRITELMQGASDHQTATGGGEE